MQSNRQLSIRLLSVCLGMFAFGYLLVPLYQAFCEWTGVNVLSLSERESKGSMNGRASAPTNTQVDTTRLITVEFDTNVRGPWRFAPEQRSIKVHPGELATVMFEFENVQDRTMSAQAIPSYAPQQAGGHFNKLECFCFNQYTLAPGEKKQWPVVFYIHPKLSKDVTTITLSYTFFEVGVGS
jgi:cytochrome c oxidase assembly protein subunit 11